MAERVRYNGYKVKIRPLISLITIISLFFIISAIVIVIIFINKHKPVKIKTIAASEKKLEKEAVIPLPPLLENKQGQKVRSFSTDGAHILQYEGDLGKIGFISDFLSDFKKYLHDSSSTLQKSFGLFPSQDDEFSIKIIDIYNEESLPFKTTSSGKSLVIILPVQPLASGQIPVDECLASVWSAGILENELPKFSTSPQWFRFGLESYAGKLDDWFIKQVLMRHHSSAKSSLIKPLDDKSDFELSMFNGVLAVNMLVSDYGIDSLRAMIKTMRNGEGFETAFTMTYQIPLSTFSDSYQKKTKKVFSASYKEIDDRFEDALHFLRNKKEKDAMIILENLIGDFPASYNRGDCLYYLAYTYFRQERYDDAVAILTDLTTHDLSITTHVDKVYYFLGRIYQKKEYPPLAEDAFERVSIISTSQIVQRAAHQRLREIGIEEPPDYWSDRQ